jgi:hypothetical protein
VELYFEACMAQTFCPLRESIESSYAQLMKLSDEQIKGFIEAWHADFGETLSVETARSEALRLLDFFAALADILRRPQQEPKKESKQ